MNKDFYYMDDKSRAVSELQAKLRVISEYDSDIPTVIADGIYGEETGEAVRAFQRKNALTPSGRVDYATFTELEAQHAEIVYMTDNEGVALDFSKLEGNVISPGERSEYVLMLKLMLSKLSERDERFATELDNYFDERTEQSVRLLQEIFGYEQNGKVDLALYKSLAELIGKCGIIHFGF